MPVLLSFGAFEAAGDNHAEVTTSHWRCFANRRLLLRSRLLSRPNPNAMSADKTGGDLIWIRRRQAARLRDLRP